MEVRIALFIIFDQINKFLQKKKTFLFFIFKYYAMASLFLSSKIQECPRRIRDVMNVFHHIKQLRSGKYELNFN